VLRPAELGQRAPEKANVAEPSLGGRGFSGAGEDVSRAVVAPDAIYQNDVALRIAGTKRQDRLIGM
jgi:hypothetical protein